MTSLTLAPLSYIIVSISGLHILQYENARGQISTGYNDKQKEIESQETGNQSVVTDKTHKTDSGNDDGIKSETKRTLQLLRSKRKFTNDSEILLVRKSYVSTNAKPQAPKAEYENRQIRENMAALSGNAANNEKHLEMENEIGLKSRMRENCTYGSVRGSRQAFHLIEQN